MLVIFYGTSCVGKTTLMRCLRDCFGWRIIPTYMTRPIRDDEREKVQVTKSELFEGEKKGDFLPLNQCYGYYYGTPTKELIKAEVDKEKVWCLDFPIERKHLFAGYKYCGIIVLPKNRKQLIDQIKSANRNERMDKILAEYEKYYDGILDSGLHTVINYPDEIQRTCNAVIEIVSQHWR